MISAKPETIEVQVLVGSQVSEALTNSYFLSAWDSLYDQCPWGSVFQSKGFAATWYKIYDTQYQPIIVKAEQEGRLTGLLTLAKATTSTVIHVAGSRDAHYQVWLAVEETGEVFIKCALTALLDAFPGHDVNFYNTPPLTPLRWATKDPAWQRHCTVRAFQRPLMNFKDVNILKVINTKRFRKKLNQLSKVGLVTFEHITDLKEFTSVLDELADQFDFRKGAKYNWTEFRNDPNKKTFLQELFKVGLLHVTVLKVNGEIVASITDTLGKNAWVHGTEIATHSCAYAKYSPGILNFMLLGQLLIKKGFSVYDLTPGGDLYKARLANDYDYVHELCVSNAYKTYAKKNIVEPARKVIRIGMRYTKFTPKALKVNYRRFTLRIRKTLYALPLWAPTALYHTIVPLKREVFHVAPQSTGLSHNIKRNSLGDLLDYDECAGEMTKWDFLSDAMQRIEAGQQPYTLSQNGQLQFCCWVSELEPGMSKNIPLLPHNSIIIQRLYYHLVSVNKLSEFLGNVAERVCKEYKVRDVYIVSNRTLLNQQINKQKYCSTPFTSDIPILYFMQSSFESTSPLQLASSYIL